MIGQQVGAYTVLSELGRGGVGVVYLAEHRHLGRKVAIKFLQAAFTDRSDLVARFFAEARAASVVDHPGIVRVLDCDVHSSGNAYIVMEYLEGESLRGYLTRRGRVPATEAAAIMLRATEAMVAAHGKGIVHRDLKPDNIFVLADPPGAVRIVDFGIAKLTRPSDDPNQTLTGLVLGTPLYMSPEQARGAATVDVRSDVYSLGCILFELLCGRPPFVARDSEALLAAHMHQTPPSAQSLEPSVPGSLSVLVSKMLAKTPADRPDLASAVIPGLASMLTGDVTLVGTRATPSARIGDPSSSSHRRRHRLLAIIVAAGATVGAGAWGLHSWRSSLAAIGDQRVGGPPIEPREQAPPEQPSSSQISEDDRHVPPEQTQVSLQPAPPANASARLPSSTTSSPQRPLAEGHAPTTLTLLTDPPGALICMVGSPLRLGLTNTKIRLETAAAQPTLLLYLRGYHIERFAIQPPSGRSNRTTIRMRRLSEDDLQAPPPCR